MAFNLQQAKSDGFSDTEVAFFLSDKFSFDLDKAKKDGFSDNEIATFLSERPTEPTPEVPRETLPVQPETPTVRNRTQLSPKEEIDFQNKYKVIAEKIDLNLNPDDPLQKYDYRGAYKAGQLEPDKFDHFPSEFKDPDHPNRFVEGIDTITGKSMTQEQISAGFEAIPSPQPVVPKQFGTQVEFAGPEQPSPMEAVLDIGKIAASVGAGMADFMATAISGTDAVVRGFIPAKLAGLSFEESIKEANKLLEQFPKVQNLISEPETETGKQALENINKGMELVFKVPGEKLAELVPEEYPNLKAVVATLTEGITFGLLHVAGTRYRQAKKLIDDTVKKGEDLKPEETKVLQDKLVEKLEQDIIIEPPLKEVPVEPVKKVKPKEITSLETLPKTEPLLSNTSRHDSIIFLEFDKTNRIPTTKEIKEKLTDADANVTVVRTTGIVSEFRNAVSFRIDVWEKKGGLSSIQAKRIFDEKIPETRFGTQKVRDIRAELEAIKEKLPEVKGKPTAELFVGERGVGAAGIRTGKETPTDITQLTKSIESNIKELKRPKEKISVAQKIADTFVRGKSSVTKAIINAKATGQAITSAYKYESKHSEFKEALGDLLLSEAKSDQAVRQFIKISTKINPKQREAIVNYIQANGDINLLKERSGKTKNSKLKRGYESATKLNDAEKLLAQNIRNYFDSKLDVLQKEGLLEEGVIDYVNQIWVKDPQFAENIIAEVNSGVLKKNPDFLKKRIYETFFEGEQAGKIPLNKDIGFLIATYDKAFNKTFYSRKFVNDLKKSKADNGNPLAISESGLNKSKELNYRDYGIVDHPSFRQPKWLRKDKEGKDVFGKENILVYNKTDTPLGRSPLRHIRNILYPSGVDAIKIGTINLGKGAKRISGEAKALLLSFSPFHQTHVSIHAWEHKTKTWRLPEIDFNDPLTAKLVKRGLQLGGSHHDFAMFYEGLSGGALIHKIPVAGRHLYEYAQWLFMEAIPRIKIEMAKNAYARNVEVNAKRTRLKKLDENQLLEMTGKQSNAAFGEQNYKWMGRNKTMQDLMRLSLLAPDFLESRIKFVGQAFRPHGTEQRAALVRGAIAMVVLMKTIEYAVGDVRDDEGKRTIDISRPLSARIGNKQYSIRSVQGDLIHLLSNPRNFVYYRLNPATTKPLIEWVTGRNKYGRPRTTKEQIEDFFKEIRPIPVQDLGKKDATTISTILHSAGFPSWTYRTDAENQARQFWFDKGVFVAAKENVEKNKLVRELIEMGRSGRPFEFKMKEYFDAGKIKHIDRLRVRREAKLSPFQSVVKRLSIGEVEEVIKVANKAEKVWLNVILKDKIARRDYVPRKKVGFPNIKAQISRQFRINK